MPLPPVATFAACGSIITACKSAWELSRMVRNKRKEVNEEKEVHLMLEDLREFVEDGVLTKKHYKRIRSEVATQMATKQKTPREMQSELLALEEALDILAAEMSSDDEEEEERPQPRPPQYRRESRPKSIQYEPHRQSLQHTRSLSPQPSHSSSSSQPLQYSRPTSQRYLPAMQAPQDQYQVPNPYQTHQVYDRRMSMPAMPR